MAIGDNWHPDILSLDRSCSVLVLNFRLDPPPHVFVLGTNPPQPLSIIEIPNRSGQGDPTHKGALGLYRRRPVPVLCARLLRPGLVHCHVCAGHLPTEPVPRFPAAQIRPLARDGHGGRCSRGGTLAAHSLGRRVPSLCPEVTRVQVLVSFFVVVATRVCVIGSIFLFSV